MANLDLTQTANPSPVDTPSIVNSLDTNTGPQASPAAFGPDLNGLAQGLDAANQDIQQTVYRDRYERKETENAQNELWALNQHANLDKQWTGTLMTAEANGQPIDPAKFNSDFQTQVDSIANGAPNDMARASFMAKATALGDNFYKQNLGAVARVNIQDRQAQAQNVISQYITAARNGSVAPADAISGIQSVGNTVAPAVPGIGDQVSMAKSQVIQAGVANVAQTQGPGPAALALRGGYGGTAIDPTHRELLATNLDNQQAIAGNTRVAIAQQNVDALAAKAAKGGFVSPGDAHAAATELANAQTAQPIPTNPPDLVDFVQTQVNKLQDLSTQITGPYAEAQLRGIQQIESQNLGKVVEQRLNGMPLEQQQEQVQKMADAFGPDDGLTKQALNLVNMNTKLLTPGDPQYAPAVAAMRNPVVVNSLTNAQNALQGASSPEDIGAAQGMMHTAITQSFAAQRILGVPPGKEQVLTLDQAKTYAEQISAPGSQPRKIFQQLQQTYGDYAPQAMTQAFGKNGSIPATFALASLNPSNDQAWGAAMFQSKMEEKDKQPFLDSIDKNPVFSAWRASQVSNTAAAQTIQDYRQALVTHADYYKQYGGSVDQAVSQAVNNTLGKGFAFAPSGNGQTISVPSSVAQNPADLSDLVSKANTGAADLIRSGVQFQSQGNLIDQSVLQRMALSDGHWVYDKGNGSPQDARMSLLYNTGDGSPVQVSLPDGRAVSFLVSGLKAASLSQVTALRASDPNPPRDYGPGGSPIAATAPTTDPYSTPGEEAEHHAVQYTGVNRLNVDINSLLPPLQTGPGINPPASLASPPATIANPVTQRLAPMSSTLDSKLPSSMKGLGPIFEKYGANLPGGPALLAAISMHETGGGTSHAFLQGHNAMGVSNSAGPIAFAHVEDSIAHEARFIAKGSPYADFRKSGNLQDLQKSYAPIGADNDPRGLNKDWIGGVSQYYNQLTDNNG